MLIYLINNKMSSYKVRNYYDDNIDTPSYTSTSDIPWNKMNKSVYVDKRESSYLKRYKSREKTKRKHERNSSNLN